MAFDTALLKFYPPVNASDPASTGYGGDTSTTATQTTGTQNNEFTNVTNDQRISGLVDYRKQFLRNENAESMADVRTWITSNTPSPDDTIAICQAGTLSLLGATVLLETATYYESATILTFQIDPTFRVRPGEWIYSVTNDATMANARCVSSVASYKVTLTASFGSSTTGDDVIGVCPATMFTFSSPASKGDAFYIGTIPATTACGMWKRRTVTAGAGGYVGNAFTVKWESG